MLTESPQIRHVVGIDFSGAAMAGKTAWIAKTDVEGDKLMVRSVEPLESLAGSAERGPALAWLVEAVRSSDKTLWPMDFPFGLPVELDFGHWTKQVDLVTQWPGTAKEFGHHCVAATQEIHGKMHVRRVTDVETKTPFDCYHYRIIYQTFHGMRDVLGPLSKDATTAVLPFQHRRLSRARRIVVEACPSSTLKRMGLPHQKYKQPGGKPVDAERRAVRNVIFKAIAHHVEMPAKMKTRLMADPGGDGLDSVLAALGGWHGVAHPRQRSHGCGWPVPEGGSDLRLAADGVCHASPRR